MELADGMPEEVYRDLQDNFPFQMGDEVRVKNRRN
jgi:hypothetical protein